MNKLSLNSVVFLITALLANSALAQSTITLDDFNLPSSSVGETEPASNTGNSEMETCLLDPKNCNNQEFTSTVTFSLDDVVNLGIVDHSQVSDSPSQTSPAASLPSIDMEILFDYDSADVRSDQLPKLIELAQLLSSDNFNGYMFAFLGHSDAKGSSEYNLQLSKERAAAVATFVASVGNLSPN